MRAALGLRAFVLAVSTIALAVLFAASLSADATLFGGAPDSCGDPSSARSRASARASRSTR